MVKLRHTFYNHLDYFSDLLQLYSEFPFYGILIVRKVQITINYAKQYLNMIVVHNLCLYYTYIQFCQFKSIINESAEKPYQLDI